MTDADLNPGPTPFVNVHVRCTDGREVIYTVRRAEADDRRPLPGSPKVGSDLDLDEFRSVAEKFSRPEYPISAVIASERALALIAEVERLRRENAQLENKPRTKPSLAPAPPELADALGAAGLLREEYPDEMARKACTCDPNGDGDPCPAHRLLERYQDLFAEYQKNRPSARVALEGRAERAEAEAERLRASTEAVLALHRTTTVEVLAYGGDRSGQRFPVQVCAECATYGDGGPAQEWPCPTAVAAGAAVKVIVG